MVSALAYMLFCAACVVLAFRRHPVWGFYFYLATIFVHPPSRWWGYMVPDLRWALLSAAVAVLAVAFHRGKLAPRPLWLANGAAALLSIYAAYMVLQTAWALDVETHLAGTVQYLKYFVAFWIVYRICDTVENVRDVLFGHAMGCTLLGIYCRLAGREGDRLDGVGGPGMDDANTLGMYLATGVVTCVALVLSQRGWRRWAALAMAAVIADGFVLANSRGAMVGLVAGGVVLMLCKAQAHRRWFWGLAVVGMLGFASIVDQAFVDRMFTIGDVATKGEEAERSARSRVVIIDAQWRMAADHPMGAGHRGTATLSTTYLDREWLTGAGQDPDAVRSSHNTFMTALVEQGVFGALVYLMIVVWILGAMLRLRRQRQHPQFAELVTLAAGCCACLAVVYVAGQTADYLLAEVQFWMFAALTASLRMIEGRTEPLARAGARAAAPLARTPT